MQLALPASYVEIEQEEMMYLDGGATFRVYGTAGSIRAKLDTVILLSVAGQASATALGGLLGGIKGAIVGFIVGAAWFGTIFSYARKAHSQVEKIISRYGTSKASVMTSTWSTIFCTGIDVKIA